MSKDLKLPLEWDEGGPRSKASGAEYQNWENKQSLMERREIIKSVAAFATAKGGTVRVGIAPNGERKGMKLGKQTVGQLANDIKTNTEPPQFPSITVDGEEDDAVLIVEVDESPIKPIFAHGVPVKRVGRTNQELKPNEVQRLMEETTNRTWDAVAYPDFAPDDASAAAVGDYCRRIGQPATPPSQALLQNLGLWNRGFATRAAVLLFAEQPTFYFPSAQVKCARFVGKESVDFLDERTLEGPLIEQLFESLAFVQRNTRQGIRITGDPQHERVPEYPEEAIREAVTNALVHRDYASTATTQIRIYDDRLEIWNPGGLPDALTLEDLYRPHSSHPRNSRLAQIFNRARLIEHFGTGTLRIVASCAAIGMPRPEFSEQSGMFVVSFANAAPEQADKTAMGDDQARLVRIARQRGRIQTSDVIEVLGVSRSTATRLLRSMETAKLLHRGGSGPQTYYSPTRPATVSPTVSPTVSDDVS